MALTYNLFAKQTDTNEVLLYADGAGPVDATIKQYNPSTLTFEDIGTLDDITEANGLTVLGLVVGTSYTWILEDVSGDLSNAVTILILNEASDADVGVTYTKTQDPLTSKFNLDIQVDSVTGIPTTKLLVIRRLTDGSDQFYQLASPVHLDEFPEDAPVPGIAFWRTDNWTLEFDSITKARAAATRLKQGFDNLAATWNYQIDFNFETEVVSHPR